MDKKEKAKVITGVVLSAVTIIVGIIAAVWIATSGVPEIQMGGSSAYGDFVRAFSFSRETDATKKWFMFASTVVIYVGIAFFIGSLVCVLARRSVRFLMLPIAGVLAFEMSAFLVMAYYQLRYVRTDVDVALPKIAAGFAIALLCFGFAAFILGMVFPRRLIVRQIDPEPVTVMATEPSSQQDPEPVPEPEKEPEVEPQPEIEQPNNDIHKEETMAKKPEPKKEKKAVAPAKAPAKAAAKPAPAKKPAPKKAPAKPEPQKIVGKYEVYPEAGFFKYRLKANNGEILVVSNPYKTKDSAIAGIDTLKKNIPMGNAKIVTDKNGFGQFRIFTGNDSRLVVAGEIYPTAARAESALNSTMKFYDAEKVVVLDEIPEAEHREWHLFKDAITPIANGKLVLSLNDEGKAIATLYANNGTVLFISATYSSKATLRKTVANLRDKLIEGENMTVSKDKQNRYQFRLYSDNGMLLLMGETYPSRDAAEKAARSTRNFIGDAKVIEE